jgi:hypothetical protein
MNADNSGLESQSNLNLDAAVSGSGTAAWSTEATGSRNRLTKIWRAQVTDRIRQVRVIQKVLNVYRKR